MHPEAHEWVSRFATTARVSVLDIGGRNVNGSVRHLFPNADPYVSIDLYAGPDVDVVADIVMWESEDVFDVVVCCEVLEHAADWRSIITAARRRLKPAGRFIMTCAGPGRAPHSALDGGFVRAGEHYGNVSLEELQDCLAQMDWSTFTVDQTSVDVRCVAVR